MTLFTLAPWPIDRRSSIHAGWLAGRVQENKEMNQLTMPTYKLLIYKVLWTIGQGGHGKNVNPDCRSRFSAKAAFGEWLNRAE